MEASRGEAVLGGSVGLRPWEPAPGAWALTWCHLRQMQAHRFPEVHHPSGLVAVQTIVNPLTPGKDVQRLVLCPEGRYRGRSQLGAMEPSLRPLALGNMAASSQQ